jgi:hypothetical protein
MKRFFYVILSFATSLILLSGGVSGKVWASDIDQMSTEQIASLRQQLPTPLVRDYQFESNNSNPHQFIATTFAGGGARLEDNQASSIRTFSKPSQNNSRLCVNYVDYSCFGTSGIGFAEANVSLPPCQLDASSSCIESLTINTASGRKLGALKRIVDNTLSPEFKSSEESFYRSINERISYWGVDSWPGIPGKNLPKPLPPSIWEVQGAPHAGGSQTYLTSVKLKLKLFKDGKVNFEGIQTEVVPFSEISGQDFHPPAWYQKETLTETYHQPIVSHRPLTGGFGDLTQANAVTCAYEEMGKCGLAYKFADGSSIELTLRLPRDLGGWFYGRVADAQLSLSPINTLLNRVTISGKPVNVPISSGQFQVFAPENERIREYESRRMSSTFPMIRKSEEAGQGGLTITQWGPEMGLDDFRAYEPLMGDRAKGQVQMWSVNTLPYWQTDNPCFADKTRVQGILTTNAMVYQAGLPTFSKGKLSYQVAGLHNNFDGTEFTGEYTLQMRADDARCLYGYSEAPIQTKVSVTDSGGTQKIATTSVSERGGWLTIRARNFTFSSPKIVVSIKQGKKSKAASTSSVSIRKGKSLSAKTLMSEAKIKAKNGDRLDISVVGSKTTGVTDAGKSLKFKSKGTYYVKVVVTRKNSSATSRVFKVVVK